MSELLRAVILGIIQGLTEFLPVSSSGHLEIARFFLEDGVQTEMGLAMSVVLHFATALATVFVFRKDVWHILSTALQKDKDSIGFILKIIVSMIPAAMVAFFFEDLLESLFNKNMLLVGSMLLITAFLLWYSEKAHTANRSLTYGKSLLIGLAQAVAILPGVSRSGSTISTALLLNVERSEAARFSFLMVVPLIFGKIAKDLLSGSLAEEAISTSALGAGFVAAFVAGFLACKWMIQIVKNARLAYFAIYCFIVGSIAIISQFI